MMVNLPTQILTKCIDAGLIQMNGSIGSVDSRSQDVQRLTYHVGEYVIAKVNSVFNATKRLK